MALDYSRTSPWTKSIAPAAKYNKRCGKLISESKRRPRIQSDQEIKIPLIFQKHKDANHRPPARVTDHEGKWKQAAGDQDEAAFFWACHAFISHKYQTDKQQSHYVTWLQCANHCRRCWENLKAEGSTRWRGEKELRHFSLYDLSNLHLTATS